MGEDLIIEDESTEAYESVPEPQTHCKDIYSVDNQSLYRVSEIGESPLLRPTKSKSSEFLKNFDFPEILGQKEIENLIKQNVSHQISEEDRMTLMEKFGYD
jgi:hypothetical protein